MLLKKRIRINLFNFKRNVFKNNYLKTDKIYFLKYRKLFKIIIIYNENKSGHKH